MGTGWAALGKEETLPADLIHPERAPGCGAGPVRTQETLILLLPRPKLWNSPAALLQPCTRASCLPNCPPPAHRPKRPHEKFLKKLSVGT